MQKNVCIFAIKLNKRTSRFCVDKGKHSVSKKERNTNVCKTVLGNKPIERILMCVCVHTHTHTYIYIYSGFLVVGLDSAKMREKSQNLSVE